MRLQRGIFVIAINLGSLQVWKGITSSQINQLISFTKKDSKILISTQDNKRFSNKTAFNEWNTEKKTIYTLTDADHNLQGIIWFSKVRLMKCDYTFAIRIYPPTRGNHVAQKFMQAVFTHFKPKSVWLKTTKDNEIAVNIYNKFGFKTNVVEENKLLMTYRQSF